MKNNLTELVFIIDRSGSMYGLEKDTVGGFNSMIGKQKQLDEPCYVSTILFNNVSEVLHDRMNIKDIHTLNVNDYVTGGCTALLDAIGGAIHHIGNIHKYARKEDIPAHTLFVITTDGYENASHKYTQKRIKEMIERQKEKYGWEFIFIGANIDAIKTANAFGIEKENAVNYHADHIGTEILYESISLKASDIRMNNSSKQWRKDLDKDFNTRK